MRKFRAYANIALIKYWGKKDEDLNLPFYNSVSVTLDAFYTDVIIDNNTTNEFIINSVSNDGSSKFIRLENHLNLLNNHFKIDSKFLIKTNNNFPIGIGLASSASSYASITYAYFVYNNLSNDLKEISKWSRIGSGSATRSLHGGFVKWEKGNSHDDSYGEVVLNNWKEFRVVVVNVSKKEKKISSRDAMKNAVLLDEYSSYVNKSVIMYNDLEKALIKKDFSTLGKIAEDNAIMLHDIINKTGINYLSKEAKKLFELARHLRTKNIETYITADAGDTVCFLVLDSNLNNLLSYLNDFQYVVSKVGGKAHEL